MWQQTLTAQTALIAAILLSWLAMVVALVIIRPKGNLLGESLRILPDLIRLLKNLTTDPAQPRGIRIRLGLLMAYLALPIDLIPDFIPVLGYADDAIVVALALRSVARRSGPAAVERHWPGSPEGLTAVMRLVSSAAEVWPVGVSSAMPPSSIRFTRSQSARTCAEL